MSIWIDNLLLTWNINDGKWDWWFLCSARWGQCFTALLPSLTAVCYFSRLHSVYRGESSLKWIVGTALKACFEASFWVITDMKKNSEMAAANTFISTGCKDAAASESSAVTFPLLLYHFCYAQMLCCLMFLLSMKQLANVWRIWSINRFKNEWVFHFLQMSFMCFKLLPE